MRPAMGRAAEKNFGAAVDHPQAELFARLLPGLETADRFADSHGISVGAFCRNVSGIGGDIWDIRALDGERLFLFLADCSGSGERAAGIALLLHGLIAGSEKIWGEPSELLAALDRNLFRALPRGQFVAMIAGVIDPVADRFRYAAAALPSPLAMGDERRLWGDGSGLPLGLTGTAEYPERILPLGPGESLILATDGVTGRLPARDALADLAAKAGCDGAALVLAAEALPPPDGADDVALIHCRRSRRRLDHAPALPRADAKIGGRRILVVEDEPDMRSLLLDELELNGFIGMGAADGMEALALLNAARPTFDAILLDKRMPGLDGFEVLRRIKASPKHRNIPVIVQTGATGAADIVEGIEAGAYHYLAKPIEMAVMTAILRAAIEDRETYAHLAREIRQRQSAIGHMVSAAFRFRTLDEANAITALLAQVCPEPKKVVVGLIELLTNAVEHGNLGITYREKTELVLAGRWESEVQRRLDLAQYRDRWAEVRFERDVDGILFTIEDMGDGFDWRRYLDFDPARLTDVHGRGIAMARRLSFAKVTYHGKGNKVMARLPGGQIR